MQGTPLAIAHLIPQHIQKHFKDTPVVPADDVPEPVEPEEGEEEEEPAPNSLPVPFADGPRVSLESLRLTPFLERVATRYHCVQLLQALDLAGVFVTYLAGPSAVHRYLPHLFTTRSKVWPPQVSVQSHRAAFS